MRHIRAGGPSYGVKDLSKWGKSHGINNTDVPHRNYLNLRPAEMTHWIPLTAAEAARLPDYDLSVGVDSFTPNRMS